MKNDTVQGYRVAIAKKYGVNVAIIYDKVQFWGTKGERPDGWVYKTYADMENETALTIKRVRLAYDKLVALGVIETKVMKVGNTPKLHFRLVQKDKSIESAKKTNLINTETTQNNNNVSDSELVSFGAKENNPQADAPAPAPNPLREFLNELIAIVNPREKATQERFRMLTARYRDYTTAEIIAAAKAFSQSKWHKENKQMSIDNLLAPSKFGRWYTASQETTVNHEDNPEVNVHNQAEMLRKRMGNGA